VAPTTNIVATIPPPYILFNYQLVLVGAPGLEPGTR
jgi:hypothetical protein